MGSITAQKILDRFALVLNDVGNVRWTVAEFLSWLNAGQIAIVEVRPDASAVVVSVPLVAGTRQALPADALALIEITRNMGADGNTPGAAIRPIDREMLDETYPEWHTAGAKTTVKRYALDLRNPKVFWVYPPQPADTSQKVEAVHSKAPTDVEAAGDTITLDDTYQNALLDYCLMRALSKDIENQSAMARAQSHEQAFYKSLGLKSQIDTAIGGAEPSGGR